MGSIPSCDPFTPSKKSDTSTKTGFWSALSSSQVSVDFSEELNSSKNRDTKILNDSIINKNDGNDGNNESGKIDRINSFRVKENGNENENENDNENEDSNNIEAKINIENDSDNKEDDLNLTTNSNISKENLVDVSSIDNFEDENCTNRTYDEDSINSKISETNLSVENNTNDTVKTETESEIILSKEHSLKSIPDYENNDDSSENGIILTHGNTQIPVLFLTKSVSQNERLNQKISEFLLGEGEVEGENWQNKTENNDEKNNVDKLILIGKQEKEIEIEKDTDSENKKSKIDDLIQHGSFNLPPPLPPSLPPSLPPTNVENEKRRSEVLGQHSFQGVGGKQCYFNLKVSTTVRLLFLFFFLLLNLMRFIFLLILYFDCLLILSCYYCIIVP